MFVGHLGAGLAAKRMEPRLGLGVLWLAAMLLDVLLWIFVLLGLEEVHVPENFGEVHYLTFTFPYSHGLIASLSWSVAAFGVAARAGGMREPGRWSRPPCSRIFSWTSWSTSPGSRVLGTGSYRLGLGLWRHTGLELAVECVLGVLGWWIYLGSARAARGAARWGLGGAVVLCAALTVAGGLATKPPPSAGAMARPRSRSSGS